MEEYRAGKCPPDNCARDEERSHGRPHLCRQSSAGDSIACARAVSPSFPSDKRLCHREPTSPHPPVIHQCSWRNLILKICRVDPEERPTTDQILGTEYGCTLESTAVLTVSMTPRRPPIVTDSSVGCFRKAPRDQGDTQRFVVRSSLGCRACRPPRANVREPRVGMAYVPQGPVPGSLTQTIPEAVARCFPFLFAPSVVGCRGHRRSQSHIRSTADGANRKERIMCLVCVCVQYMYQLSISIQSFMY